LCAGAENIIKMNWSAMAMRTREGNIPVLAHWDAPPKIQVRNYSPLEDRGFEPLISPRAGTDLASDGVQLGVAK
jgi:hypothetical protein